MKSITDLIVKENGKFIVEISLEKYEFATESEEFNFMRSFLSRLPINKLKKSGNCSRNVSINPALSNKD